MQNIRSNLKFAGLETKMGDKEDEQQDFSKDGDSSIEVGKELMALSTMADKEIGNCSFGGESVMGESYTDLTNQANNVAQEDNSKLRGIDEVSMKDRESTWQTIEYVSESMDIDGVDKWAKVLDNEKELDLNSGKQANKSVEAGPISQESDKRRGGLVGTCDGPIIKKVLYNSNNNLTPSRLNRGSISPKLQRERKNRKKMVKRLDGAWLLDQRIMVKHARRKDNEQRWREVKHYELQNLDKTIVGKEKHMVYQQQNISCSKSEINKEK